MKQAQVALSKDFLTALSRLPKKVAKKVREFTEKFRADPTSSGINLEPLAGVADDKVRSVRIGDDYRAIVIHPPKGDVFLCVWVDHHDEAYRWVRNKRFEVHPQAGVLQLYDVQAATEAAERTRTVRTEPAERSLFADTTDEDLLLGGVPAPLLPAIRALRDDDDLDALKPHLPEDAAEVLVGLAAGFSLSEALAEVEREKPAKVDAEDFGTALARPASQQRFHVVADEADLTTILDAPLQQWRVFLHPSQRRLVAMQANGPVRVLGGAGTGKTVVLMHRARHLAREVFRGPDDRILVTTYTRNLAKDLEANLRHMCGDEFRRIEVVHLHAWAARFLRRLGRELKIATAKDVNEMLSAAIQETDDLGLPEGFFADEWQQVVQAQDIDDETGYLRARRVGRGTRLSRRQRADVWRVFERYREIRSDRGLTEWPDVLRATRAAIEAGKLDVRYRAVLSDEVQDFEAGELRLLRALVPAGPADLFLVGDGHQRIYGRGVALGSCGIDIRGRSRRLKVNYRTTEEIRDLAIRVLDGLDIDDLDGGVDSLRGYTSLRGGPRPAREHFAKDADEAGFVVATLRRWLEERPGHELCVAARTNKLVQARYRPLLEEAGIACAVVESESDEDLPRDAVRLATMHRMKGLEFSCVLLAGVQGGTVPMTFSAPDAAAREAQETRERCLFYVAATRARDELVIAGHGEPSPFLAG